jgi:hypothetical protein
MNDGSSHPFRQSIQPIDSKSESATVAQDCRTTVSHNGATESAISVCNREKNSRPDCNTRLPVERAAHRRKQRPTGLWLRGTVWQFRTRVPCDAVPTVGRQFVNRSLRTSDYREAIRQARIVAFEIEQMFRGVRIAPRDHAPQPSCVFESPNASTTQPERTESCHDAPTAPSMPKLTLKEVYRRYIVDS